MTYVQLVDTLLERGLIADRNAAVVANAKALPNGEYGLALLCLKENTLFIYDVDFHHNIGDLLYKIDLTKASDFKSSSFIFNRYLNFVYEGFRYKLADFGNAKAFLAVLSSEINK